MSVLARLGIKVYETFTGLKGINDILKVNEVPERKHTKLMRNKKITKREQAAGLAALAGMRTLSAPALLSAYLQKHPSRRLRHTNFNFMQSGKTAGILKLLAAAEMVGDKLPATPNRTKPFAVLGRGLSGALVGATLSRSQRKRRFGGAGIGLLSALAATYGSFYLRKKLTKSTPVPGPVWGVLEDALVWQAGKRLLKR